MYVVTRDDFEDDFSKEVFDLRKKYYLEKSGNYLVKLVCRMHDSFAEKLSRINREYLDIIQKNRKKLLVFGTGEVGSRTARALELYGLGHRQVAFLDNNKEKQNGFLYNKPIWSVEKIVEEKEQYMILIPLGFYAYQMKQQLLELGFSMEQILVTNLMDYEPDEKRTGKDYEALLFDKTKSFAVYGSNFWCEALFLAMIKQSDVTLVPKGESEYCIVLDYNSKKELLSAGMEEERILSFAPSMDKYQYFDPEIVPSHKIGKSEMFVDGGSFNLQTSELFLEWCQGDCERIYAFECSEQGVEFCKSRKESDTELCERVELVPKGLWSEDTTLFFEKDQNLTGSRIVPWETPDKIETTSIDKVLNGNKVTFIKMDIEGAELEALKGAKESIKKWHPTLAISVYHKPEDIITLPSFIKEIEPGYKLYLRCYHEDHTEMVLYALWDKEK